jgi:hypothetical protein
MNMGLGFNNNNHKLYKCVNVKDDMHNQPLFIKDFCCSDFLFSTTSSFNKTGTTVKSLYQWFLSLMDSTIHNTHITYCCQYIEDEHQMD